MPESKEVNAVIFRGWEQMNRLEKRALAVSVILLLLSVLSCVCIFLTDLPVFQRLFYVFLAGVFLCHGLCDLRRHKAAAAGEFIIAAAVFAIGMI